MMQTAMDLLNEQQPAESTSLSSLPLPYHDDPARRPRESLLPQQYIDSATGRPRPLVVQSLRSPHSGQDTQLFGTWKTVKASAKASLALRLSAWVVGDINAQSNVALNTMAYLGAVLKAVILSPLFAYLTMLGIDDPISTPGKHRAAPPIPKEYAEFRGECHEYPKHTHSVLDTAPARHDNTSGANNNAISANGREQERLYRPRRLFVKVGKAWRTLDGDGAQGEKPYIFISYAANQFGREQDASGRLILTDEASKRLKQRAEAVVEESNLEAYWIDFLRAPEQPEATDDVHRFCDVVRGSEKVCVLLSEDKEMSTSLAMFGKRLWCLPECLLAPGHVIHAQGGGKSEIIGIMQLPARAWTKPYTDDAGNVVQGTGKREEFRLLAEHFSGLLTLSRLELFSVALSAMRALEFFAFQDGDMAYALMGLLRKRPSMDPSDSEQQALARLCLSNDSDRIIERMVCMLPIREVESSSWLGTADSFGANLWDIEPLCQVAGICNDEAIIVDSCHAVPIEWSSIPRIRFKSRKSKTQGLVLMILRSSIVWNSTLLFLLLLVAVLDIVLASYGRPPGPEPLVIKGMRLWARLAAYPCLILGFLAPFCMSFVFKGEVQEIQPWLIGFQGTMPIEQLESMVFGNHVGRLEYTASSGLLCSRDNSTRKGIAPVIDMEAMPVGYSVFTLLDTVSHTTKSTTYDANVVQGNLTVTIFSSARPPIVALLCGKEGGMLRVLLCSYNQLTNSLRKENVLRKETRMWERSASCGWIKLEL